ncbi:phage holin family protein [Sporichthya brevicatena]|uniref:Phage holin family protein n=1 Tax=Sporichthya brevicatena TaxID=171442 RepID=A0ABN1GGV9_9ACTN
MTQMSTHRRSDPADMSMGELVSSLSEQTSRLVRDEIKLATKELQAKGKHAGLGAGMFGGAGVVALYGVGALVAAAIGGLALAMDVWAAALIVAAVLFAVAAVLGLTGKKQVKQAVPPAPEQAMAGVKSDIETVKEHARR